MYDNGTINSGMAMHKQGFIDNHQAKKANAENQKTYLYCWMFSHIYLYFTNNTTKIVGFYEPNHPYFL